MEGKMLLPAIKRTEPSLRSNKRKRHTVAAACERCRTRKIKCDAQRPHCDKCVAAGSECKYTVLDGQTRHDATRAKVERMEDDFNSMRKLLDVLRQSDKAGAQDLLDRMRDSDDSINFARSYAKRRLSQTVHPQDLLGRPNPTSRSEFDPACAIQDPANTAPDLSFASGERQISKGAHELPDIRDTLDEAKFRVAISSFTRCAGKLFHICEKDDVEMSFDLVFRNSGNDKSLHAMALCRLSSLAVVGCLYMKGTKGDELKDTYYQIAKSLLDTCIEQDPLGSATFCTLICMFNVMSHATVALAYIELGISLCRQFHLHTVCRPSFLTPAKWMSGKRAWRSLIFFGTWISATIGYLSGNEWDSPGGTSDFSVAADCSEIDVEDMVQIQMVKIAVLKRNILHINMQFPHMTSFTVDTVKQDLSKWYDQLPPIMQLKNLLRNHSDMSVDRDLRRTIYLVHLLYLGALMLLYRRITVQSKRITPIAQLDSPRSWIRKLATDSAVAAEQSARILGLLLDEDGIFERCWAMIFQAYSAATLLLYRIVESNVRARLPDTWNAENLDHVDKCMRVLAICGTVDPVAFKFQQTLRPYHEQVEAAFEIPFTGPHPNLERMETELYNLVIMPFENIGERDLAGNKADDVGLALHSHVDWVDSYKTVSDRQQATVSACGKPDGPLVDTLIGKLQPAHTFREFSTCGWF